MSVTAGAERIPLGAELICPLYPMYDGLATPDVPRPPLRVAGRRVWLATQSPTIQVVDETGVFWRKTG